MTQETYDKMGEKENKNKITLDTTIQLSMGKMASLLGGMLVLFFGFYSLVIGPKLSAHDDAIIEIKKTELENTLMLNGHLIDINNTLGTLNGTVAGFGERFNDLRGLRNSNDNTSGGFDSN